MSFLLQQLLLHPRRILDLDNAQLNQLISQARSSNLLASLAMELASEHLENQLSPNVTRHFQSALLVHEKQKRDLNYDIEKIRLALDSIGEKLVLLKGAAYLLAELPVGRGRLISDIDIIVPFLRIDPTERALNEVGWESSYVNSYNEYYYRKWGHEIPPLTHLKRGTTLDVHHNILPPTAGPNVDASLLFERLIEVKPGIFTLSQQDMVIHSATHLFHEGEFRHGLRDMWDLDRMLRDFPDQDPSFWKGLVDRARELELLGSLYHGLHYAQRVFGTPLPAGIIEEAENLSRRLRKPFMDFLFLRAFQPDHPQCRQRFTSLALYLLYVRSHFLRMPLYLLLPHLARKAWMRHFDKKDSLENEQNPEAI
ncbi:MAG: nucleotidyltransferase family protein [Halioglobus sp.]|nr:nucleotidyltransferase family protein [Halioglobus sp.]